MNFFVKIALACTATITASSVVAKPIVEAELVEIIEKARVNFNIPSMAILTFNSQGILNKEIRGVRRVGSKQQARLDDFYHIGSSAKSVLSVLAGRLVEEGKVTWETKFFDVFPELKSESRQEYFDTTLNTLLSCRSGVQAYTSYLEMKGLNEQQKTVPLEFVKHLIKQPPVSKRLDGEFEFLYSNASYTMAAMMLERITGTSWKDIVKNGVEKDLGLSVIFGWPNDLESEQPWGHSIITDEPYADWLELNEKSAIATNNNELHSFSPDSEFRLPTVIAPAGDLSMSPLDYAKYGQIHLQGLKGVSNIISAETYHTIYHRYPGFSYGVGSLVSMGEGVATYSGSAGTFYVLTMLFPDSDFGYVILINSGAKDAIQGVNWASSRVTKKYFNLWWMFWS